MRVGEVHGTRWEAVLEEPLSSEVVERPLTSREITRQVTLRRPHPSQRHCTFTELRMACENLERRERERDEMYLEVFGLRKGCDFVRHRHPVEEELLHHLLVAHGQRPVHVKDHLSETRSDPRVPSDLTRTTLAPGGRMKS